MQIVGISRLDAEGKQEDVFVMGCEAHNFWYRGMPPLTHGCRDCWEAYYIGEWTRAGGKPEHVDQLEAAIHHAAELADKGEFDFKPSYDIQIDKDVN